MIVRMLTKENSDFPSYHRKDYSGRKHGPVSYEGGFLEIRAASLQHMFRLTCLARDAPAQPSSGDRVCAGQSTPINGSIS